MRPAVRQQTVGSEVTLAGLASRIEALRPLVDAHVTAERVERYVTAVADMPAPSTAAAALRLPVLRDLLAADGVLDDGFMSIDSNFHNTASPVILTGDADAERPLWYFAHLDTISYLIQPFDGRRYPLIPFCHHLTELGRRTARAYRFDLQTARYVVAAEGWLVSEAGTPYFESAAAVVNLRAGDRVVPVTKCRPIANGRWAGHFDNAGAVAALAVAAPVLAQAGVAALLALPDEEEGPKGSENQVIGRGGSRLIARLPAPDLALIADMQQSDDPSRPGTNFGTHLGGGAVLSEFSSLARGAVTPPPLYALARHVVTLLADIGVQVQESSNVYTSRSDDVSVMLRTPNILLLGFPGFNRHFDNGDPGADLSDIVDLTKALIYMSLLQPLVRQFSQAGGRL